MTTLTKIILVLLFSIACLGIAYVFFGGEKVEAPTVANQENGGLRAVEDVAGTDVPYFEGAVGYFVEPEEEGTYPGVVLIHENRGLRPEIKAQAEELAREGYMVLAVDLYDGVVMETQEEARAFGATYDEARGLENLKSATAFLRERGATKIASLGWCFGGAQSLALSTSEVPLDATIIYYGRLNTDASVIAEVQGPVLGIFGDQDQVVPVDSVTAFEEALDARGVENEIYMYEGVGHAFANPSNPNFAQVETADAWSKTLAFLEAHLR